MRKDASVLSFKLQFTIVTGTLQSVSNCQKKNTHWYYIPYLTKKIDGFFSQIMCCHTILSFNDPGKKRILEPRIYHS